MTLPMVAPEASTSPARTSLSPRSTPSTEGFPIIDLTDG